MEWHSSGNCWGRSPPLLASPTNNKLLFVSRRGLRKLPSQIMAYAILSSMFRASTAHDRVVSLPWPTETVKIDRKKNIARF